MTHRLLGLGSAPSPTYVAHWSTALPKIRLLLVLVGLMNTQRRDYLNAFSGKKWEIHSQGHNLELQVSASICPSAKWVRPWLLLYIQQRRPKRWGEQIPKARSSGLGVIGLSYWPERPS